MSSSLYLLLSCIAIGFYLNSDMLSSLIYGITLSRKELYSYGVYGITLSRKELYSYGESAICFVI
jgi:uncharacterized membrane protein YadS